MTIEQSVVSQGIAAARGGDKRTARRLLSEAVRQKPDSGLAWLWLSEVMDTPQGRAHCLRQVLALEPDNVAAQRGLAAVELTGPAPAIITRPEAVPAVVARPAPVPAAPAAAKDRRPAGEALRSLAARGRERLRRWRLAPSGVRPPQGRLWSRPAFWRALVAALALVAVSLVALLMYATAERGPAQAPAEAADRAPGVMPVAMIVTPRPHATLRPTFTPPPADTPPPAVTPPSLVRTVTWTGVALPPRLLTRTPTLVEMGWTMPLPPLLATITPTPDPARAARAVVPVRSTAVPTARPAPRVLPPRTWDPRLTALNIRVEPAAPAPGQGYWRLVEARWTDGEESGGKHTIYVEVQNAAGARAVGQPVIFEWASGSDMLLVENRPPPDWGVNFAMYNTLGSYSARVGNGASDKVVGMGMGTIEQPHFTVHTCFYLTFRWVQP